MAGCDGPSTPYAEAVHSRIDFNLNFNCRILYKITLLNIHAGAAIFAYF